MGFISENLGKSETILYEARLSKVNFWAFLFLGIITLPLYGVGLLILLVALVSYMSIKTTEFAVTDKKIMIKYGIFTVTSQEINFNKIESIYVNQTITGKMFKYGDVVIAGTGGSRQVLEFIDNPLEFRREISEAMDKYGK